MENRALKPHPSEAEQPFPTPLRVKLKVLWVTFTFIVRHRQSLKSGLMSIPAVAQVTMLATDGSTSVHKLPALSGLCGPQNRLEFSHRTTPDQLSVKVLPVLENSVPYGPAPRLSEPDSEI